MWPIVSNEEGGAMSLGRHSSNASPGECNKYNDQLQCIKRNKFWIFKSDF